MKYPRPEPSMLELRGAADLLRRALRHISDAHASAEHSATYGGRRCSEQERASRQRVHSVAYDIVANASYGVNADLKAVLGQNKEYTQAAALWRVK